MVEDIKLVIVRSAKVEDLPAITAMLADLAAFEGALHPPHLTVKGLERDVFGPEPRLFIAVAEVMDNHRLRPAGLISWFENYSSWQGRSGVHIGDLWTCPEYRRGGIGSRLINHVLRLCEGMRVDLFVLRENLAARAFYERHGFQCQPEWCLYRMEARESCASQKQSPVL
jgi:GNAT superfamily N-acetyltransferase